MTWNLQQLFIERYAPLLEWAFKDAMVYSVDLFHRYVQYSTVKSITAIIIDLLVLVALAYVMRKSMKKAKQKEEDEDNDFSLYHIAFILSVLGVVILVCWLACDIVNLQKLIYVPEVYIYQDLTSDHR